MDAKKTIINKLSKQESFMVDMATQIWENPQIALEETFASDLQANALREQGFTVEQDVAQMPTAFVASWGSGAPIIGILGEYDALPGLSQTISTTKEPIVDAGPGHGCGHNLYGTAGLGAAIAVKEVMEAEGIIGTIRYYGCPAEETLVGKTFMAKHGLFDDLDASITWHPGSTNSLTMGSSAALNSFKVNFHGVASHAGATPHLGRSALDAAQLFDVGVNYLREHVIPEARMHTVITNGGGAPNVVPALAQTWMYVRAPNRQYVDEIYERVLAIAEGACLMTGTTHDIDFLTGCYDYLANKVVSDVMYENLKIIDGSMEFTAEEIKFSKELQTTFPEGSLRNDIRGTIANTEGTTEETFERPLVGEVLKHSANPPAMGGSTEVADVSHITPTVQITTVCWPMGTPIHNWQTVAASGSSIGMKGMMFSAKAMALTAYDLLTDAETLAKAHEEFKAVKKGQPYVSPLPDDAYPH